MCYEASIVVDEGVLDRKLHCSMLSVFQLEGKVQQGERDFEQISKTIRKEVSRFEVRTIDGYLAARNLQNIQR